MFLWTSIIQAPNKSHWQNKLFGTGRKDLAKIFPSTTHILSSAEREFLTNVASFQRDINRLFQQSEIYCQESLLQQKGKKKSTKHKKLACFFVLNRLSRHHHSVIAPKQRSQKYRKCCRRNGSFLLITGDQPTGIIVSRPPGLFMPLHLVGNSTNATLRQRYAVQCACVPQYVGMKTQSLQQ